MADSAHTPGCELVAGPVTMLFEDGMLHYVRYGDREILRRVYVAVRDSTWATMPMKLSDMVVKQEGAAFSVSFEASCKGVGKGSNIDFHWHGTIEGSAEGRIAFRMEGEARSDFESNRIGICVLHPIDGYQGKPWQIETVDGAQIAATFPDTIDPHLPFSNVRSMTHEVSPGTVATIHLLGDTFETEDQRQWGDASLKTYSRPVALPRPYEVNTGSWVVQTMTLELRTEGPAPARYVQPQEVEIRLDLAKEHRLPQLGVVLPPEAPLHTEAERARLAALGLHHVRFELVSIRRDSQEQLERAVAESRALKVPLELALFCSRSPSRELSRLVQTLEHLNPRLSGIVLASMIDDGPAAEVRRVTKKALSHVVPDVEVGVGVYAHFTELNRNRDLAAGAKFLSVPFWPQVHQDDDRTLAENLAAPRWQVETARSFAPGLPYCMGPIALRKQPRAGAAEQTQLGVGDVGLPAHVDARQGTVFAAGWTALHIRAIAAAGVARADYFQTRGWLGVIPGDVGMPAAFATPAGAQVFPIFHVLADVGEFARSGGATVVDSQSSDELEVGALALKKGNQMRILLVNLGTRARVVSLRGAAGQGTLKTLGAANAAHAMTDPDAFRSAKGAAWAGQPVPLEPGQIARLDGQL